MTVRAAAVAALLACALAAVAALAVEQLAGEDRADPAAEWAARSAGVRFLDRYVDPDGRVVRRDQGGDTVSEGQAYAMLVAAAVDDERRFRAVWSWTQEHLQRSDGMLSWLWRDGSVQDPQPATDADIDAARALLIAAERFDAPELRRDAERLGRAIIEQSTLTVGDRRVLLAGPWARERRLINPSYVSPRTYRVLREATEAPAWEDLTEEGRAMARTLVGRVPPVVPDWADVTLAGRVRAAPPPSRPDQTPQFGLDAQRLPVRFAESCDGEDRRVAADMWTFLRERARADELVLAYELDGTPAVKASHPLTLVAAAAAAHAAGDDGARDDLLLRGQRLDAEQPTYYGAAWVALGRLMLTTETLGDCP